MQTRSGRRYARGGASRRRRRTRTPARRRVRRRISRPGRLPLRSLLPYPERFKTTLHYNEDFSLNGGAGTFDWQLMRATSLYDPNYTGTGHQPLYFDNLSAVYAKYIVRCCYITITILEVNTSGYAVDQAVEYSKAPTIGRLYCVRDKTYADIAAATPSVLSEERCPNIRWRYYGTSTTGRLPRLRFKCKPWKQLRLSYNDDSLAAATNANPTAECFLAFGITGVADAVDPPSIRVNVRLAYKCEFFDRIVGQTQN